MALVVACSVVPLAPRSVQGRYKKQEYRGMMDFHR